MSLRTLFILLLSMPMLASCDMLYDLLDIPNPQTRAALAEADGRAIGSGCRHSGRSLEDCYTLNPNAAKAAVFAGWREMNDYMIEHKLTEVPSLMVPAKPVETPQPEPTPAPSSIMTPPPSH